MITYCAILTAIGIGLIVVGFLTLRRAIKEFRKEDDNVLLEIFGPIGSMFLFVMGLMCTCGYGPKLLAILCGIE